MILFLPLAFILLHRLKWELIGCLKFSTGFLSDYLYGIKTAGSQIPPRRPEFVIN